MDQPDRLLGHSDFGPEDDPLDPETAAIKALVGAAYDFVLNNPIFTCAEIHQALVDAGVVSAHQGEFEALLPTIIECIETEALLNGATITRRIEGESYDDITCTVIGLEELSVPGDGDSKDDLADVDVDGLLDDLGVDRVVLAAEPKAKGAKSAGENPLRAVLGLVGARNPAQTPEVQVEATVGDIARAVIERLGWDVARREGALVSHIVWCVEGVSRHPAKIEDVIERLRTQGALVRRGTAPDNENDWRMFLRGFVRMSSKQEWHDQVSAAVSKLELSYPQVPKESVQPVVTPARKSQPKPTTPEVAKVTNVTEVTEVINEPEVQTSVVFTPDDLKIVERVFHLLGSSYPPKRGASVGDIVALCRSNDNVRTIIDRVAARGYLVVGTNKTKGIFVKLLPEFPRWGRDVASWQEAVLTIIEKLGVDTSSDLDAEPT